MGRRVIPFVSSDRYDPKEVFVYIDHDLEPHESFSHATQTSTRNSIFNVIWKKIRNLLANHVEY